MTTTDYENLLVETRDRVAWIAVNRPDKLNALNRRTVEELGAAVEAAGSSPDVGVIVLSGAGEKAFVAGADIQEMASMSAGDAQAFSHMLNGNLRRIERSPKPVIAAIQGFALGGGCELALACHVRIASDTARFGQPEVSLGLIPGAGGTQRLQRLVGKGRALDLILTGEMIPADEAHRIGLVEHVVRAGDLRTFVQAYAGKLLAKSPVALARAIEAVVSGGEVALPEALRLEAALFGLAFATEDMREGTRAFLEKRKPSFSGK